MKFFKLMKDGGKDSRVYGYFLAEIKKLFTIVVLKFENGSREAYHNHAFNSISWVLRGQLHEHRLLFTPKGARNGMKVTVYKPSLKPVITTRDNMHMVVSKDTTYVISFRGPWANTWQEFLPNLKKFITLTHGRKVVGE